MYMNKTTDGLSRTYSTAFELERGTIDGWRTLVAPDCVIIVPRPMPYRVLWQRPVLMLSSRLPLPATVAILHDDVRTLLDDGTCVYIYETQREQDAAFLMLHDSFRLESVGRVPIPEEVAGVTGFYKELSLYRVKAVAS
jgi:hypothetical protein